jgi:hypothetical protein
MGTIALFLGAGFSKPWGLPLTKELLPSSKEEWEQIIEEKFPRKYQQKYARRVQVSWLKYLDECQGSGSVDQFAEKLQTDEQGAMGLPFDDLAYFLAVRLAVEESETREFHMQTQFVGHHFGMQDAVLPCYDGIIQVLDRDSLRGIVTTNYDLVVEKILGPDATGRLGGFNYGTQGQPLHKRHHEFNTQRWYHRETIDGTIPLLKLHGSLNWASSKEKGIDIYVDCYPSLTQGHHPVIVPPHSDILQYDLLSKIWQKASEVLQGADIWVFCGYSFPPYDEDVRDLMKRSASILRRVVILSPHATALGQNIRNILNASGPEIEVKCGPGLGGELTSTKFRSLISDNDYSESE